MIKLFATVSKKEGMPDEDFQNHWLKKHAEIICSSPKSAPDVRKYTQCHTLKAAYTEAAPAYDGVAELWFDDLKAMKGWFNHPYYREMVRPDELIFVNLENVEFFITQEICMDINPTDGNMVKVIAFIKRKPGMDSRAFYLYWQYNHAPIVMSTSSWDNYIRHYVQNHVIHSAHDRKPRFDGFPCVWFDDAESFEEWAQHPDVSEVIQEDEKKFIDRSRLRFLATKEHYII